MTVEILAALQDRKVCMYNGIPVELFKVLKDDTVNMLSWNMPPHHWKWLNLVSTPIYKKQLSML